MTFTECRSSAASPFLQALGLELDGITTGGAFAQHAEQRPRDELVAKARQIAGASSSGQRTLLAAILTAAGFRFLAAEIQPDAWSGFDNLDGESRIAAAATIARLDG